ncbi:MAG TPA: hypothetical protein VGF17_25605 [Phytomonospora sp.]
MTTLAALQDTVLDVTPGEPASLFLTLRNTGSIVEGYTLTVVGTAETWTTVEPAELSLYPDTDAQVRLTFNAPRNSDVPAGDVPFAVRVLPREHPETAVAPEGLLRVQPFTDTTGELTPRTAGGRIFSRTEVAVDNRGNIPVSVRVDAKDADDALRFEARPPQQPVQPGQAVFTKQSVRARKPRWRGPSITHPYAVAITTMDKKDRETQAPVLLDGNLVQNPIIPRHAGRWLAALLALALLAALGWMFLLKPAVQSAAENAVASPVEELNEKVAAAEEKAEAADDKAEEAKSGNPGASTEPPPPGTTRSPLSTRLEADAGPNATATDDYVVPEKTTFSLTDIVLENPQGDTGRLDVEVNGALLFTVSLANFRDLDYHFVTPLRVPAEKSVVIRLTCQKPGPRLVGTNSDVCRSFVLIAGTNAKKAET